MGSFPSRGATKATLSLQSFKAMPRIKPLQLAGHSIVLAITAYVAAAIHGSIAIASLILALAVGVSLTILILVVSDLHRAVETLGGVLLRIDYQKVGAKNQDGVEITEAMLYDRARLAIERARESIDIFTSSMVEPDSRSDVNNEARRKYFRSVLNRMQAQDDLFEYRRIVQAPPDENLNVTFAKSRIYRDHLHEMASLESKGYNVLLKRLDCRRPTTYLIIDKSVLIWQINRIGDDNEMEMHGMFFIDDPARELIEHFSREFDSYFKHECISVKPDLSTNEQPERASRISA